MLERARPGPVRRAEPAPGFLTYQSTLAHEVEAIIAEEHRLADKHRWRTEYAAVRRFLDVGLELRGYFGRIEVGRHTGKTAIVTGASSGIGRASAEVLARAGFTVFGTSRKPNSEGPNQVSMLACDVTDEESVASLVSAVLSRGGRIDVLVNNAGLGLFGGAEESSLAQVQSLFDVNLFGVVRMTNAVLPSMRERGGGRIINLSSALGFVPAPYSAHYAASKHAVEGYSESLDHEVRGFKVRVSLIEPATVQGSFDQSALEPDKKLSAYDAGRAWVHSFYKKALLTAVGPEKVADAVRLAATAARPRLRYTVGKTASQISLLRRLMPARTFDNALRQQFGLPS